MMREKYTLEITESEIEYEEKEVQRVILFAYIGMEL